MPNVNGKKYPYTPAGMAAAKKAAKAKPKPGMLNKKPGNKGPATSKMRPMPYKAPSRRPSRRGM